MDEDKLLKQMTAQEIRRYETLLFDYETTARTDLRLGYGREPSSKTTFKVPVKARKTFPHPVKETQTMTEWKDGKPVPFDLFIKPNDILHRDPRRVQEYFDPGPNLEREMVRKTRPRLVMTPAISVDDANKEELKIILEDTYLTTSLRDLRDGIARIEPAKPVIAPLVPVPAPPVPIKLERQKPYVVPEAWRMETAAWDGKQLRSCCDYKREFWIRPRDVQSIGNGMF